MADVTLSGPSSPGIVVNYSFDTCYIDPAPSVLFSGAAVGSGHSASPASGTSAIPAIISTGATNSITAGTYSGGAGYTGQDGPTSAIVSRSDISFSVSGGTMTGANGIIGADCIFSASPGAAIYDAAAGSISGGSFVGGDAVSGSDFQGGTGLFLSLSSADYTISGGTFTGGSGDGSGSVGNSLGFYVADGRTLTVSGGTFTGNAVGRIESGSKLRVYTTPGFVPVCTDGTSFTATGGTGYIDYG